MGGKQLNPYLDEEMIALGDQVRRFAADRIAPGFQERDRTRVLYRPSLTSLGEKWFFCP